MVNHQSKREDIENIIPYNQKKRVVCITLFFYFLIKTSLGNSTDGLEIGMVVAWTLSVNPSDNYLECNGQAVDSTKYPKLYEQMHNTPDYRGVFLRGLGGNSASLGILQGDAIRNITGTMGVFSF